MSKTNVYGDLNLHESNDKTIHFNAIAPADTIDFVAPTVTVNGSAIVTGATNDLQAVTDNGAATTNTIVLSTLESTPVTSDVNLFGTTTTGDINFGKNITQGHINIGTNSVGGDIRLGSGHANCQVQVKNDLNVAVDLSFTGFSGTNISSTTVNTDISIFDTTTSGDITIGAGKTSGTFTLGSAATTVTVVGDLDVSGSLKIQDSGAGTNDITITADDPVTAHTLTLPGANAAGVLTNDGAGALSWDGPITFAAYANSGQVIGAGSDTKVSFQNEEWDVGGYFDSTTNYRYTPLIAGYYQINASVRFTTLLAGSVNCSLWKNGSNYRQGDHNNQYNDINTMVHFNGSTDYIEFKVFTSVGGTIAGGDTLKTVFNGHLAK